MKIGVIGSGSWGTALVKILTQNENDVTWCVRSERIANHIRSRKHNPKYLSSVYFNNNHLNIVTDPAVVYQDTEAIVIAVPSGYVEDYIMPYLEKIADGKVVISATKGMLPNSNLLLNQFLKKHSEFDEKNYVAIMGPCHAEEVAAERLSYLTFAGADVALATNVASFFSTPYINTVVSADVDGVQYAAVLKNVYAIGTGIAHGLGYGDNFQSVLIANAAGEMKKFLRSIAAGSEKVNYAASVYLGDLLVTCYSLYSRNRSFGNMVGKGYSVEAAKLAMQMVAEGFPASKSIHDLGVGFSVDTPIATGIYKILWEKEDPAEVFASLEKAFI
jgi:glycerol-3-phosphate dehydrogenase (NAD(P)+)